jgi:hypothetical protein
MATLRPRSSDGPEVPANELSEEQASRMLIERTVLDEQARGAGERDAQTWGV